MAKATVEVQARSMVCIDGIGPVAADKLWFIPQPGRGGKRGIRIGDRLPIGHPVVLANPGRFAPSPEPVDAWPAGLLTDEARAAREAATVRLDPDWCQRVRPACRRCGAESATVVDLIDPPTPVDLVSAVSGLEDHDYTGRAHVEAKFAQLAADSKASHDALAAAEQQWRVVHPQCPDGTPPLPEPAVPEQAPLFRRLESFRTL